MEKLRHCIVQVILSGFFEGGEGKHGYACSKFKNKLASNLALLKEGSTKDQDNSSKQVMQLTDINRKANHQHDTLKPEPSSFTFFSRTFLTFYQCLTAGTL